MRNIMSENRIDSNALKAIEGFHTEIVAEVEKAIATHEWVIVGMAQNPVVKKARKYLFDKGIPFHYIEHGSYFSKWKQRLAIKLWSGWPTFPQVFHRGKLIGGFADLKKYNPPAN
ncbi:MAG: glutaredoxin [Bdellovibrionales bacterium]|nr:glutaredoxin [Bdellovibrionales bacterium]